MAREQGNKHHSGGVMTVTTMVFLWFLSDHITVGLKVLSFYRTSQQSTYKVPLETKEHDDGDNH